MSGVTRAIVGMSATPLDLAESPWIAGKCWPSAAGFLANQASTVANVHTSKARARHMSQPINALISLTQG